MSTETYANDYNEVNVSYKFKHNLDAENWNSDRKDILSSGIYAITEPLFTKVDNFSVTVNKYTALVLNPNVSFTESVGQTTIIRDILTKIEARTTKTITSIDYTAPYIVLEFLYTQSETVVPSIKNIAYSAIDSTKHVVLGKCLYRDNIGTKDELYGFDIERSIDKSTIYEAEDWFNQFVGIVTGAKQITIQGGLLEGIQVDDLVINYGSGGGETAIPAAGKHRYDLIYVDAADDLVVLIGEEETDVGSDEYPKPDRAVLALYDFPVCYIYVSGNLQGSRVIQPTDIENIKPRFMKKYQVLSGSLSDIIIANQVDCDAYFGTNSTDNQGGTTPGLYGDGFTCEYNSSIKSVYVPGKRIVFKNQFDENGNQVPYNIHNRVLLQTDSEVYKAKGVILKFTRNMAHFVTKNQTNMLVDEYTGSNFEVLSEDSYYTDNLADNYGNQAVMNPGDIIFGFSDTPSINRKYTINDIVKGIKEDTNLHPSATGSFDNLEIENGSFNNISTPNFNTVDFEYGGNKYILAVFEIPGTPDTMGYSIYQYSTSTKEYTRVAGNDNCLGGAYTTITNVQVEKDNRTATGSNPEIHLVFSDASSVWHFHQTMQNIISSQSNFISNSVIIGAAHTKNDIFVTNDGYVYVTTRDGANNLDFYKSTTNSGTYSWTAVENIDSGLTNLERLSISKIGNTVLITYAKTGARTTLYCAYSTNNGTAWNTAEIDNGGGSEHCGFSSKMDLTGLSGTGDYDFYVAYNYNSAKDTVKFAEINTTGAPVLTNKQTILYTNTARYDYMDMRLNTSNQYTSAANDLIQVIAWDNDDSTGTYGLHVAMSTDGGANWNTNEVDVVEFDNKGVISSLFNDYLFVSYYNDTTDAGGYDSNNYLLKLYYNFEVTVNETITPTGLTDVVISPDFVDNAKLEVEIDVDSKIGTDVINVGNAIDSDFRLELKNANHTTGINGDIKTHNLVIKPRLYESNLLVNNISEIRHSSILEGDIVNTGLKNFNNCNNININSLVDHISIIGQGNFDS